MSFEAEVDRLIQTVERDVQSVSPRQKKEIISFIDLTNLNETADTKAINELCALAQDNPYHQVAAVCVFPHFIAQVAKALGHTAIKIATVANFPTGNNQLEDVLKTIHMALEQGATEIDVVLPYQLYLSGEKAAACDYIRACKAAVGKHTLKVILETGAILDNKVLSEMAEDVLHAGADFLKTSTGKIATGATLNAAAILLLSIKKWAPTLKRPIGFKASGGIRNCVQGWQYMQLAELILGAKRLELSHFRLGTSQLLI